MFWVLLLLLAWTVAGAASTRLYLATADAVTVGRAGPGPAARYGPGPELSLYEAAFLSGGPARVADLALVSMARRHRLLLAHTGWASVVDPCGHDELERAVIGALGPEGQCRITPLRARVADTDAVRALAGRLVAAGLAVPDGARTTVTAGVRRVRAAAGFVLLLGAAALLTPGAPGGMPDPLVALWFALPLALTLSCLAAVRVELPAYARWASPAGRRLLDAVARHPWPRDDQAYLACVALRGIEVIDEPDLRAAFAHGDEHRWYERIP